MRTASTAIFPLAIVASLALLTFWLERAANPEDPARKALNRHDPDFIISSIDARHFDVNGKLTQELLAEKMTHYPDDDSTHLELPKLTYYTGDQTTLLLAKTALVSHDNKQVDLNGDVRLIKPPFANRPATTLQTETLTVFPDDDIAQGNMRVTISKGESVVSGNSIHYDGRNEVTILAGRVNGIYYRVKKP